MLMFPDATMELLKYHLCHVFPDFVERVFKEYLIRLQSQVFTISKDSVANPGNVEGHISIYPTSNHIFILALSLWNFKH